MFTKTLSAGLVALLASSVSAQTHTDCSPLKKDCPPDAALGKSISIDYTQGADKSGFFKQLDGTSLEYGDKGAVFKIESEAQAPTLVSNKYIFFGRIDVQLQAAPGVGIVTSVVLQSDDLDEIDWEWVGGDTKQVQTNYFSKGDTTTYDRGAFHPVANPQSTFHTYSIDWTKDYVRWIIDGNVVRELTYAAAKGGSAFPQTPCQIRIGTWVAGRKDAAKGTVDWAGGYANFADAPFIGYYKSVKVTDYSTGATSYVYGDRSGTYQSIQIKTDGSSDNTNSTSDASTSPTGSTSSAAPTSSSNSSTSGTDSASNTTATGSGSSSQPSETSSTASTSAPLSNAGKTGSSAGAAQTTPVAPSSGAASLPNILMVGAAAVIGYLAL